MARYFRQKEPSQTTNYLAIGEKPISDEDSGYGRVRQFPYVSAQVYKPPTIANFDSKGDLSQDYLASYDPETYPNSPSDSPQTLFTDRPAQVSALFAHSSMRHAVPQLLSIIKKEYPDVGAPSSLSQHSSKLVQHAMDKGLISKDTRVSSEVNPFTFNDSRYVRTVHGEEDIANRLNTVREYTPNEMVSNRSYMKNLLRPKRARGPHYKVTGGQQFTQPQLPGMEGM